MKKLLSALMCLVMVLSLLPIAVFANGGQETVIIETTSTFVTEQEALDGTWVSFKAIADGTVTVQISDCSPGYWVEVYEENNWVEDYYDAQPAVLTLNVTSGVSYELYISCYDPVEDSQVAGFVTFKISSAVVTTEEEKPGDDSASDESGSSESNPLQIGETHSLYIDAGQTIWFAHTDSENDGTDKMLHINGRTNYAVSYNGNDVPVDSDGYVNYLMDNSGQEGKYLFSVTNNGTYKVYFTVSVTKHPAYVDTGIMLELGDNDIHLSAEAANSLYGFTPDETGVYQFTVSEGVIGNWGTSFNPVDNTAEKTKTLSWTCTSVGQSVLVGVTGTTATIVNVARTDDYIPPVEIPWDYYEITYDFSYEIPFDADIIDIDVTDPEEDVAVLDKDGFYRYGSANGPLMVADLSNVEIDILDAYNYGQLRAYLYDENGTQIARIDYNEAMYEYATYGLAPVTEELATMIKQVGDTHSWWTAGGFVFADTAPLNEESAWMAFCSYIKGSELNDDTSGPNNGGNGNNNTGNDQNNGNTVTPDDDNPGNDGFSGGTSGGSNNGTNSGNLGGSTNSSGGNTVTGSDSHSTPTGGNGGGSPGTGDVSMIGAFVIMLLSAAALVVLVNMKKKFI